MLDGKIVDLTSKISKNRGAITVSNWDTTPGDETFLSQITYLNDGKIYIRNFTNGIIGSPTLLMDGTMLSGWWDNNSIIYYPDGTVTVGDINSDFYTIENITKCPLSILSYEEVLKQNPLQTYDDAAKAFVGMNKERFEIINKKQLNEESILVFTADYGLYWWDYQSGYDFVLAELAWNPSVAQHIGLVRGAANLQGKSWGTCITWKYTHSPYLTDGVEMFEQMKVSYEAGAEYVLIFNYSEDPANPNILQEEHFISLERFWNEVVQNSDVVHGGVKAETVLVLPRNYGWGMRRSDYIAEDFIWGIWSEDAKTQEIWDQLQSKMDQYGLKLDIVFEDSNYSVTGKYVHIYYWNQNHMLMHIILVILLITIPLTLLIIFYKFVNKKRKLSVSNG